jgi:hypothetical protein
MHMHLDFATIRRLAQEVASTYSPSLKVVGVLPRAEGSDYVELLINIEGCRQEPCQLHLGIFRNASAAALKQQLSAKLREHLESHRAA